MDDSHLSRLDAKRPRLQENVNVLTCFGSTVQSKVDAVDDLWKFECEKEAKKKLDWKVKHNELQIKYEKLENMFDDSKQKNEELQKKNKELQEKHEVLEESHKNLHLFSNNQTSLISQLPSKIEVTRLNEAIARSEAKRNLSEVAGLEKAQEIDKTKIAEVEKKQEDARQAFENEKKVSKERFEQQMKALMESYEKECARLHQNIAELNAKNKDRDQLIDDLKKQHEEDKAKLTAEMEKKVETDRKAHEKEKKFLVARNIELEAKQVADQQAYEEDLKNRLIAEILRPNGDTSDVPSNSALINSPTVNSNTVNFVSSSSNLSAISKSTNANDDQLVITKLFRVQDGKEWEAYLTLEENEQPSKLCLKSSYLLINGEKVSKKLAIDGLLYQSKIDPFKGFTHNYDEEYRPFIANLLKHVHSCNLTDLFLYNQQMSWMDYEKLVSTGKIKSLYFSNVHIKNEKNRLALLDEIMEKVPNIEEFGCAINNRRGSIKLTIETFEKLLELPLFENLKIFNMYGIIATDPFDVDSFLEFMKKYPCCRFTVSFRSFMKTSVNQKDRFDSIIKKLHIACPSRDKLVIEML